MATYFMIIHLSPGPGLDGRRWRPKAPLDDAGRVDL